MPYAPLPPPGGWGPDPHSVRTWFLAALFVVAIESPLVVWGIWLTHAMKATF